jgi:hypothetical protein
MAGIERLSVRFCSNDCRGPLSVARAIWVFRWRMCGHSWSCPTMGSVRPSTGASWRGRILRGSAPRSTRFVRWRTSYSASLMTVQNRPDAASWSCFRTAKPPRVEAVGHCRCAMRGTKRPQPASSRQSFTLDNPLIHNLGSPHATKHHHSQSHKDLFPLHWSATIPVIGWRAAIPPLSSLYRALCYMYNVWITCIYVV